MRCLHMHSLSLPHHFMYRSFVSTNEALLVPVLLMTVQIVATNDTVIRIYEWTTHSYIRMIQPFVYTIDCIIRIYEWLYHSYLRMVTTYRTKTGYGCEYMLRYYTCRSRGKYRLNNVPRSNRASGKGCQGKILIPTYPLEPTL